MEASQDKRLSELGFVRDEEAISYSENYAPPGCTLERIVCIPHGRTPSNAQLLFQSHAEGPNGCLLPESFDDAEAGARAFFKQYGSRLVEAPGACSHRKNA